MLKCITSPSTCKLSIEFSCCIRFLHTQLAYLLREKNTPRHLMSGDISHHHQSEAPFASPHALNAFHIVLLEEINKTTLSHSAYDSVVFIVVFSFEKKQSSQCNGIKASCILCVIWDELLGSFWINMYRMGKFEERVGRKAKQKAYLGIYLFWIKKQGNIMICIARDMRGGGDQSNIKNQWWIERLMGSFWNVCGSFCELFKLLLLLFFFKKAPNPIVQMGIAHTSNCRHNNVKYHHLEWTSMAPNTPCGS